MSASFFEQARSGRRITPVWFAMPGSVFVLIASIVLGKIIFGPHITQLFGTETDIQASLFTGGFVQMLRDITELGPAIVMIWCIVRFYEGRRLSSLGLQSNNMVWQLSTGALMGFSLMALWGLIGYLTGALIIEKTYSNTTGIGLGFVFAFIGVMVQTTAEELIFRGWLFQVLSNRWGYLIGAIVTSLIFAAPHAMNEDITILALVNILLLSFFFALLVWYQQSIWTLIGFHWFYNWTQFSIIGLDVTSEENIGGAIFNLAYTNNFPFVTSGVVAEDGPLMSVISIVAILVMFKLMKNKRERGRVV